MNASPMSIDDAVAWVKGSNFEPGPRSCWGRAGLSGPNVIRSGPDMDCIYGPSGPTPPDLLIRVARPKL